MSFGTGTASEFDRAGASGAWADAVGCLQCRTCAGADGDRVGGALCEAPNPEYGEGRAESTDAISARGERGRDYVRRDRDDGGCGQATVGRRGAKFITEPLAGRRHAASGGPACSMESATRSSRVTGETQRSIGSTRPSRHIPSLPRDFPRGPGRTGGGRFLPACRWAPRFSHRSPRWLWPPCRCPAPRSCTRTPS